MVPSQGVMNFLRTRISRIRFSGIQFPTYIFYKKYFLELAKDLLGNLINLSNTNLPFRDDRDPDLYPDEIGKVFL